MYKSRAYLAEFYDRTVKSAETTFGDDFEIILVNDGSPDDSLVVAKGLADCDDRVCVVDLSRNFGHHRAIMTGLAQARGKDVFLIDIDLEEPPECLAALDAARKEAGADVAFGVQASRKGDAGERITGWLFWEILRFSSSLEIPSSPLTARLMSRRYVQALVAHQEREIFLAGLWFITGFHQVPVTIEKGSKGSSTYDLAKRVSLFVNSITSFTNFPLIFISYIGAAITFLAGIIGIYIIALKVFSPKIVEGWVSIVVSIWLMGGLTFLFLGIIGIYISKIFIEVKQRPYSIIKEIYRRPT